MTERDIEELVSKYGTIISRKGLLRGLWQVSWSRFVQFENSAIAEAAMKRQNDTIWNKTELTVKNLSRLTRELRIY